VRLPSVALAGTLYHRGGGPHREERPNRAGSCGSVPIPLKDLSLRLSRTVRDREPWRKGPNAGDPSGSASRERAAGSSVIVIWQLAARVLPLSVTGELHSRGRARAFTRRSSSHDARSAPHLPAVSCTGSGLSADRTSRVQPARVGSDPARDRLPAGRPLVSGVCVKPAWATPRSPAARGASAR
jgi:hypothetical protein